MRPDVCIVIAGAIALGLNSVNATAGDGNHTPGVILLAQADTGAGLSYADSMLQRAEALLNASGAERNPALAARILKDAASTGSVSAMLKLARLYADGDGVEKDTGQAESLLKDAIAAGDVSGGAWALGDLYFSAEPPRAEEGEAAYELSIASGNTTVMRLLAGMLLDGKVLHVDRNRAKGLIEQAIAAGDVRDGAAALGDFYRDSDPAGLPNAVASYERAIAAGNDGSMLQLSRILLAGGEGVVADPERAKRLIEDAIAAGNVRGGALALGNFYRSVEPPDFAAAAAAYRHAVDAGETWGLLSLADMARAGQGEPVDFAKAKRLIEEAIAAGNVIAGAEFLGDLYLNADPANRSPGLAAAAYQQAIDAGNVDARLALAKLVNAGDGVPADPARARTLIEEAIAAGNVRQGAAALGDFLRRASPPEPAAAVFAYEKAVDLGNPGAMLSLADMLRNAEGIPADLLRAETLIEQAIAAGDVRYGAFALGQLRLQQNPPDVTGAVAAYEQSAAAGGTAAMLELASLLTAGDGIPANPARAKSLIEMAIAAGDVTSGAMALGDFLRTSTRPDMPGAVAAYEQAIAAGSQRAMLALANVLRAGDGVPVDNARAQSLIEGVIAAGNVRDGQMALGDFYRLTGQPAAAAPAYEAAADLGSPWAMLALANLVRAGEGVPADFNRARELIEASIAAGNVAGGSVALGDLYRQSGEPNRDLAKAVAAYEQAVAVGDPGAMLTLAQMLKAGDGATADPARAKALIESAIAAGEVNRGALALGDLYRQATPPDYDKALVAYEQSMATGNTWAMLALADMHRNGQGVAADPDRAKALMEQAIAGGNVGAGAFALGELYRLGSPPDLEQALAAHEQAAAAGNAESDLIAAKLVSVNYTNADSLRSMAEHLVTAAKSLEPRRVALDMLQLPPQPLIAAVQQLLGDSGERVGIPDGTHGARTKRAIADFCARRGVADCDQEFITVGLMVALLQQPEAEPATQ